MRRSKLIMCGNVMGIAFKGGIASHSASTFLSPLDDSDLDVFNPNSLMKKSRRRRNCLPDVLAHVLAYGTFPVFSVFSWRALQSQGAGACVCPARLEASASALDSVETMYFPHQDTVALVFLPMRALKFPKNLYAMRLAVHRQRSHNRFLLQPACH